MKVGGLHITGVFVSAEGQNLTHVENLRIWFKLFILGSAYFNDS